MKLKEKYELAKWVIGKSLELGAQEAGVTIFSSLSNSVEVRDRRIDKLEQANQAGLTVKLLVSNRYSAHSTNRLQNRSELEKFIAGAIASTAYLSVDDYRSLPSPDLYFKGVGTDLKLFDDKFNEIAPQARINTAFQIEKEAKGLDKRIISFTASYYDGTNQIVMLTSNGFEGDSSSTYYGVGASVSVDGGMAKPQSGWSESSLFRDELITEGIARSAVERAVSKIGQNKISSEKLPMIVENRQMGQLLSPMITALNGAAIQQKNSFLVDSMGEKVGSEIMTIIDDPGIISGRGSKHFDNEGLALSRRPIFSNGVLKNYYIDTYYGKKLGMPPTSGSTSNLIFEGGSRKPEDLISSLKKGILVSGFNGGNANGATGDYSYGIEGFLVEDGRIVKPVSEMNITGNMKELWSNLEETANDPYEGSAWRTPTMKFKDVDFSGL